MGAPPQLPAKHDGDHSGFPHKSLRMSRLFLPQLGCLRYRNSREVLGEVKQVTISKLSVRDEAMKKYLKKNSLFSTMPFGAKNVVIGARGRQAMFVGTAPHRGCARIGVLFHQAALAGIIALLAGTPGHSAAATIDSGQIVNVPGDHASPWDIGDSLTIGTDSAGGTLNIRDGGNVSNNIGSIGQGVNGANGTVVVAGPGSKWTNNQNVYVGYSPSSDASGLTISDGGAVFGNRNSYIGYQAGSKGEVAVTGTGSVWTNVNSLFVGESGYGRLTISEGGAVTLGGIPSTPNSYGDGYIGNQQNSMGEVIVTGHNSTWTIRDLTVGNGGTGTLTISDGGVVANMFSNTFAPGSYIGRYVGSAGEVTVTGGGSMWTSPGALSVGYGGAGALNILDSGVVVSASGNIGMLGGANYGEGTVKVDGRGSQWTMGGALVVGSGGSGALNITNGGAVSSNVGTIGFNSIGTGSVTVDGPSSNWTIANNFSSNFYVGWDGAGELNITNGGSVFSSYAIVGTNGNSRGTVTVSGPSSRWANDGWLVAGWYGAGNLTVSDGGEVSAAAIYVGQPGGSDSIINIGAAQGDPAAAPGTLTTASVVLAAQGSLVFNHTSADGSYLFDPQILGAGSIKQIAGATNLTGNSSSFFGATSVTGGALLVNSTLGNASSTVTVSSDGKLGGNGTIGGNVTIADGSLNPGNAGFGGSVGTLTIGGNLNLASTTTLNYNFGEHDVVGGRLNDLTVVHGDLTLDGTLNVTATVDGSFDPGIYRIISYDGALIDNDLALGTLTRVPTFTIQTSIDKQVNLIYADSGVTVNFWDGDDGPKNDGAVNGGDGTWRGPSGNNNWTNKDGDENEQYVNGSFAVFSGKAGTVTVDNSSGIVRSGGMQFATSGYVIQGDSITLEQGGNIIRVGDDTDQGANFRATIASALVGAGGIDKRDAGTLILTGANTYGGGTTITLGALQLGDGGTAGSIEGDVTDNATFAFNRSDTFTFASAISGTGGVAQIGPGTTILAGANIYLGPTDILAGTLQAGAENVLSPNSIVTVASAGTLDLHGSDQTVAGLTHAGLVNMGTGAAPGTVLTVNGNYVGQGGTIVLNAILNADPPSDKLIISNGTASGNSFLRIVNAGGAGGLTTGNGALVIEAINGAATEPDAFALSGRVVAGPYEYALFQGGVDGHESDNWYLRSSYRVETSVYTALPSMMLLYGRNLLDTLHARVGDEEDIHRRDDLHQYAPTTGGWGRAFGTHGKQDGDALGISGSGPQYDYDFFGLQVGQDLLRAEHADTSSDHLGVYLAYGHANGTVTHFDGATGTNRFDAYTLGGYWTHFGETGWYIDTVLQGIYYDTSSTAHAGLPDLDTHGYGLGISVEGGKPFRFDHGYFIEPQAQLSYQAINMADANDTEAQVNFSQVDSLTGRIGARFGRTWALDGERQLTAWVQPNIWREFSGNPATQFSSADGDIPFHADLSGSWGEINIGVSGQYTSAVTLFANASCSQHFAGDGHAYGGRIGLRINW